jgi:hypothetical protein
MGDVVVVSDGWETLVIILRAPDVIDSDPRLLHGASAISLQTTWVSRGTVTSHVSCLMSSANIHRNWAYYEL